MEVKNKLIVAINNFLDPVRERREQVASQSGFVEHVIYEGTLKMSEVAQDTLGQMKKAMGFAGVWNRISRMARDRMKKLEKAKVA